MDDPAKLCELGQCLARDVGEGVVALEEIFVACMRDSRWPVEA